MELEPDLVVVGPQSLGQTLFRGRSCSLLQGQGFSMLCGGLSWTCRMTESLFAACSQGSTAHCKQDLECPMAKAKQKTGPCSHRGTTGKDWHTNSRGLRCGATSGSDVPRVLSSWSGPHPALHLLKSAQMILVCSPRLRTAGLEKVGVAQLCPTFFDS